MSLNNTSSMLPPMHVPHLPTSCHGGGGRPSSNTASDSGGTPPANLVEESMMILSQSIDSIHTMGTNVGSEGLDHQVRTLFVSGLPLDAKSRELYLLFRGFKGYLSSTLKPAGKNGKLTAPVGFVTFETREQAENALDDLQGVKFDPEGNQHMRLEFARSNTKVTKPKCPGLPIGFPFVSLNSPSSANLSPISQQVAFPGVVTSNFLPFSGFDPTMALFAAQDAANQWGNPHFGYDQTGLYSAAQGLAPAALLQASNFRAILPMNAGTPGNQANLQLVQAAIAQANAAAALGLVTGSHPQVSNAVTSQQSFGSTSLIGTNGGAMRTLSSPMGVSSASPLTVELANQQAATQSTAASNAAFAVQFHNQQILANQIAQHHQQQQQVQTTQTQQQQVRQHQQQTAAAMAAGLPVGLLPGIANTAVGFLGFKALMKDMPDQQYGQVTANGSSVGSAATAHTLSY